MSKKDTDLTGKRIGRLLANKVSNYKMSSAGSTLIPYWECLCDCGNTTSVSVYSLLSEKTVSCGCLQKETVKNLMTTHGRSDTTERKIFSNMCSRCNNPTNPQYANYGGRGIHVCDRWNISKGGSFENFLEDMGERPKGMTLDRIDVNGNYCKENCRWATTGLQAYNIRKKKNNSSGRTGVYWEPRWEHYYVLITKDGKTHYVGSEDTFEKACEMRTAAEIEYYGVQKE